MKIKTLGVLLVMFAAPVSAQPGPPPAPGPVSLPMSVALEAAEAAQGACTAKNSATAVQVFDANGFLKVALVADGTRTGLIEFARRKAYTVIKKKVSSREFGKPLGNKMDAGAPAIEGDANLIAYAGGLPVLKNGQLVGALAVSGPGGQDQDEDCAMAGLAKIKDRL